MQLSLFEQFPQEQVNNSLLITKFSHDNICRQEARLELERQYCHLMSEDHRFSRKIVSFQANKTELVHSWMHYREGFSAPLVETLLKEFNLHPGDSVLDPFAGSATTLLVAKTLGLNSTGIEILPNCHLAWEAKSRFAEYDIEELLRVKEQIIQVHPQDTSRHFPHITITEGAFSPETERDIMFFQQFFSELEVSENTKILLELILMSILEEVSFTRKDGQYLRWDYRANKVQERNLVRESQDKKSVKKVDKGLLPSVKEAISSALTTVIMDITALQRLDFSPSTQQLIKDNTLFTLPKFAENTFDAVLTSPPYCNRYDYTRTYALELAFLGVNSNIFDLRQGLLSCTVESRSKDKALQEFYKAIGKEDQYHRVLELINNNSAYIEINEALKVRWGRKDLNNKGVLPMVKQYFTELAFVFAELFRVCRPGGHVGFVNDDVRYGGEIIPVDTITTNIAEGLGFEPLHIYVLPQKKGNSSQQMGKFGREELRKSITVWRKPRQ